MPRPRELTAQRISRLFDTFSALDIPLIARALDLPQPTVSAQLAQLARRGDLVRLPTHSRHTRRPLVRVVFEVAA